LEVKNGFVELEMSHASEYYLTQSEIKDMGIYSTFFVVAVAEAGIILALLILLVLRRKRKQANLTVL
jgi:F0F1-type ATP synthase membrane subunit c/vacuolar-type H+-ATPase subunit K